VASLKSAIGAAVLLLGLTAPCAAAPVAVLDSGRVAGEAAGAIAIFRGIPYAAPPVGALRWRPPQKVRLWKGIRQATRFGLPCPQAGADANIDITRYGGAPEPTGEDCLTLNVWAPAQAAKAPVMVWIHGGAGKIGASSLPVYDGSAFARDGVVFVGINYRLGHLGMFLHPALQDAEGGAFTIEDQIAALNWVKRNIAAFGGDPGRVTLAGESFGGRSVLVLSATPAARGLFARAIVESGGGWFPPWPGRAEAEKSGEDVAAAAGAPPHPSAGQLRALPAQALAKARGASLASPDRALFPQSVTGAIAAGHQARVPLLIGVNDGEDVLLDWSGTLRPVLAATGPAEIQELEKLYGPGTTPELAIRYRFRDNVMTAPARWLAAEWSAVAPVYLYRFEHVDEARRPQQRRAAHGDELFYVFETLDHRFDDPPPPTEADRKLAAQIHARWVAFVKSGVPDAQDAPSWPAYSKDSDPWLVFGQEATAVQQHVLQKQLDYYQSKFAPPP